MKYYNQYYQGTDMKLQIWLLEKLGRLDGKILEVGSGEGKLLDFCRDNGVPCGGVEIIDELLQKLSEKGHEVYKTVYDAPLHDFKYLYMCAVIEHMDFAQVEYLLKNFNGTLLIETPDIRIESAPFHLPFIKRLSFWDDYQHVKPYTPTSLKRLLVDHGYQVAEEGRVKTILDSKIKYFILEAVAKLNYLWAGIMHPYYVVAEKRTGDSLE